MANLEEILNARSAELCSIDDTIICDIAGVTQAAGDLRASLDTLDNLLMARKFEAAAALGYRDIASAFIFLQRTLGGLQDAEQRRHAFMSEIAEALRCSYEDVEPQVSARLECLKPRLDLTDEERASAEVWLRYRLRKMGSCSES